MLLQLSFHLGHCGFVLLQPFNKLSFSDLPVVDEVVGIGQWQGGGEFFVGAMDAVASADAIGNGVDDVTQAILR